MLTQAVDGDSRLSFWLRVREFAVPPSMIETATARRHAGDWAGACAAAGIDVDLDLRSVARAHGRELAARLRTDLRHLAPDLLRWHLPRIAPDGLLRPGLTISLARYGPAGEVGVQPVHLVVRTAPAWADAGQRISLALWDGSDGRADAASRHRARPDSRSRPDRRFRLDLHRHLWDVRRTAELRVRSGADTAAAPALARLLPPGHHCAVDRWAAETQILLRAEGRSTGTVGVRLGGGRRLALDVLADRDTLGPPALRITPVPRGGAASALPVLPDAATWVLPDLDLIRAGLIEADRLHPLVASALVPGHRPRARTQERAGHPLLVECQGAQHRIGLVDGVLAPLDHDPAEIRREELLAALTGTPMPCLQTIDTAHRRPDCLTGVRERLDHGDTAGALAVVESLLGPDALLRSGELRDALEAAARRRITYGLFRAGLALPGPGSVHPNVPQPGIHRRDCRTHPRHATVR
ncbi:hypothetical protein [Kitasatospora sp. McL0602]|uniref:hypothetical protein n=1 Tax=Kitasatospora sp. McL0602 TaxID=3439530 RepID=UPI003F8BB192